MQSTIQTISVRILTAIIACSGASVPVRAQPVHADCFRIQSPGPTGHEVEQGSDLCFGAVSGRKGLWIACDRNGGRSAGRIYLIRPETLAAAKTGGTIVADEEFVIAPPSGGWTEFRKTHAALSPSVLDHIQQRVEAGVSGAEGARLDLEAITIGCSADSPQDERLFVVAEEPYSVVLELTLAKDERTGQAQEREPSKAILLAAYQYHEREDQQGQDHNDGLEGFAYAGSPGEFWWTEEGTRLNKPDAHPRLFFSDPRVGVAQLRAGDFKIDEACSNKATDATRGLKEGDSQTLNALSPTRDGRLLMVDRNGGWILVLNARDLTASRWFNVYHLAGANLREVLANFPGPRQMPYVSIEGIALDSAGNVWLVDDPAMPEPFRASCLVRLSGLPSMPDDGQPATQPASQPTGRPIERATKEPLPRATHRH